MPRTSRRKTTHTLWVAIAVVAATTSCSYEQADLAPELPANAESSSIYAADGTLITTLQAEENRASVRLRDIPPVLQNAVIAIEDERFWEHNGVDLRAIARAAEANTSVGGVSQGGSTITQQYVKNALLTTDQTLNRKVEEAALAVQLERSYSKEVILELYLNTIYFGHGAYGVEAATREYFGVGVGEITLPQAALLAALIQSPGSTDPYVRVAEATDRRDLVLSEMLDQAYIDQEEHDAAVAAPLALTAEVPNTVVQPYAAAHFVEEVKQWILGDEHFGATRAERRELLFGGGLRIFTTIDLAAQAQAEAAVASVLDDPSRDPDGALVAIDPRTGYVRAMVGGRDYFAPPELAPYAKLNLAAGKGRSTGSAFKPLVLATALSEGVAPDTAFPSPSSTVLSGTFGSWRVQGGGGLGGQASLRECTIHSSNTCFANVILDERVGPDLAIEYAGRLGITTELESVPAAVLGSNDATVLDMASAYSSFANRGLHTEPVLVTRIVRSDGSVVFENDHIPVRVLEEPVADEINSILQGVIERGTGTDADLGRPAAGKTGSAQDNTDAWFVGYTPDLVAAVWVGYAQTGSNNRLRPLRPPNTPITVFGGTWPARIWATFMEAALAPVPPTAFVPPSGAGPVLVAEGSANRPTSSGADLFPLSSRRRSSTTVPDVSTMSRSEAIAALDDFDVETSYVPHPTIRAGFVVAQAPPAGTSALRGSTVVVEVVPGADDPSATGPPSTILLPRAEAEVRLRGAGMTVQVVIAAIGDIDDDGDVDSTDDALANGITPAAPDPNSSTTTIPPPRPPWPSVAPGEVWHQTPPIGVPTSSRSATIWIVG